MNHLTIEQRSKILRGLCYCDNTLYRPGVTGTGQAPDFFKTAILSFRLIKY